MFFFLYYQIVVWSPKIEYRRGEGGIWIYCYCCLHLIVWDQILITKRGKGTFVFVFVVFAQRLIARRGHIVVFSRSEASWQKSPGSKTHLVANTI